MKLSEYNEKLKEITDEYDQKKNVIAREYALYHSVAEIGDIVEDHCCKSKVEKIHIYRGARVPSCVYVGPELKKDGTPRKDGRIHHCYQLNIKK